MERPGKSLARTVAVAAALAVGAAALVTGCGGAGSSDGAGAPGRCASVPGVTSNHLTYGLLYPVTGDNASAIGPYRAGVDARLGAINATGGVYGRTVGYTRADDGGSPASNLSSAQRLVNSEGVFGLDEFSFAPAGSAGWLHHAGIPVVGTSNDPIWTKYSNMFSYLNFVTDNSGSVSTWGEYARDQQVHKAVVLYSKLTGGSQLIGTKFQQSLEAAHIPTAAIEAEPGSLDLPTLVQQIRATGADLVTGFLDPETFIKIAIQAQQALPGIKIMSAVGYDPGVLAIGQALAGMTVFVGYTPFERPLPAHKAFLDAIAEYAPEQQPAAQEIALTGWIDTDLFLRGLQAAGPCPTRESFMTNLRAVTNYDADGLLAAPVNMRTIQSDPTTCYWFLRISKDGKAFDPVGTKALCGSQLK